MSEPYAVLVQSGSRGLTMVDAYGPFEEEEADAFAERLRRDFQLKAAAVRLQPWTGRTSYQRMEDAAREIQE